MTKYKILLINESYGSAKTLKRGTSCIIFNINRKVSW